MTDGPSRPVIGIAGGSGSGKTTIALALADALGTKNVISQDLYYHPKPEGVRHKDRNYDEPDAIEWSLLARHVAELAAGRSIMAPSYRYATADRGEPVEIIPADGPVIVEGTMILSPKAIRKSLDIAIHVEIDPEIQLERRIRRDVAERGCSPEETLRMWNDTVLPMQRLHVDPGRIVADVVIGNVPTDVAVKALLSRIPDLLVRSRRQN
jgi:uridine kinase